MFFSKNGLIFLFLLLDLMFLAVLFLFLGNFFIFRGAFMRNKNSNVRVVKRKLNKCKDVCRSYSKLFLFVCLKDNCII